MNELTMAILEVQREITVRNTVYPKLVIQGRLTQGEADRRAKALRYALYYLEAAAGHSTPSNPTTGE